MVKSALAQYMQQVFLFEFDEEITESTDLFKAGIIDSHGYIQLMLFIQDTFRIKLSRDELLSGVISSLRALANLVEAKLEYERRGVDRRV
jgi:acyl carrier protein